MYNFEINILPEPCEIDEKGACGGDCRMRDETCARYKVVPGGPDPWPNQEAYSDGSDSWKCKCVAPTALNINDMVIDNFSRDDLESKVAQLSDDETLDNLLQIEVTNDMIANFQVFDAHKSDCVFGILNYLKLVPRRVNLNIAAQNLRGANTAEMLDFFSENRDNNFYKYVFLPIKYDPAKMIRGLNAIEQRIKDNHAVVFGFIRKHNPNHVMILMKFQGKLMLVEPQNCQAGKILVIEGKEHILAYLYKAQDTIEWFVIAHFGHEFWYSVGQREEEQRQREEEERRQREEEERRQREEEERRQREEQRRLQEEEQRRREEKQQPQEQQHFDRAFNDIFNKYRLARADRMRRRLNDQDAQIVNQFGAALSVPVPQLVQNLYLAEDNEQKNLYVQAFQTNIPVETLVRMWDIYDQLILYKIYEIISGGVYRTKNPLLEFLILEKGYRPTDVLLMVEPELFIDFERVWGTPGSHQFLNFLQGHPQFKQFFPE